tara:strand:- start:191 stop:430 length:240 start_codon:yes stop_codon:yes gene_type:complete
MYNIWDYRPKALNRLDQRTLARSMSSQFFAKHESIDPVIWLGETCDTTVTLFGPDWKRLITFKHPVGVSEIGSFWKVIQ